jgi:hypothetical protein
MSRFGPYDRGYRAVKTAIASYVRKIYSAPQVDNIVPIVEIPFDRDPYFVGRESELAALDSILSGSTGVCSEAAIVGLGGTGYVLGNFVQSRL